MFEPSFPPPAKRGCPRSSDLREVVNAVHCMSDTGCQWRALPPCFSPSAAVQNYFYEWSREGVFDQLMNTLCVCERELAGRSETPVAVVIGSQSVETAESRRPRGYDAGKKAERRKRHLAVDIEGFPIKIATHEASVLDRDRAPAVTLGVLKKASHVKKIWADGGYRGRKPEKDFCSGSDFGPLCRYWDKLLG